MPTWGEQLHELRRLKEAAAKNPSAQGGPSPVDTLRRKYLNELHHHTGRAVIVYTTCWLENKPVNNEEALSIRLGDKQGFMEAVLQYFPRRN